jgi:hypothetical protein
MQSIHKVATRELSDGWSLDRFHQQRAVLLGVGDGSRHSQAGAGGGAKHSLVGSMGALAFFAGVHLGIRHDLIGVVNATGNGR